jgi:hypothetical protein
VKKLAIVLLSITLACAQKPERRLTEAELRMIVTAQSLGDWGIPDLDARAQKIETIPGIDGSLRVKCEYDSDLIPNAKQPLFYVSDAHFYTTAIGAEKGFREAIAAYKEGVSRVRGRHVHEAPTLLKMGDERYSAYIQNGKVITGNIFVIRRGRVLHSLVISKLYFDEVDGIRRLFAPMLEAAAKFENS